jgi:DNA topoisomerase-2
MKLEQYFNEEVKQFSLYDCENSIADYRDGLKTVQRKIIHGIIKGYGENKDPAKVFSLVGIITTTSHYHHGNTSMEQAIIKMAQDFSGSNNINLLLPDGQFGSRLDDEAGAPRYIFSKFSDNFRKYFLKDDDIILNYRNSEDDGTKIEPEVYYPILPFILVNGHEGIGTGFAMKVLSYNPKEIKEQIENIVLGKKNKELIPWYKDFKGKIEKIKNEDNDYSILIKGVIKKESLTTLRITELPIGVYIEKYREILNKLEDEGVIKDYEDNSTEKQFDFLIRTTKDITSLSEEKLLEKFKLIKREKENLTFWKSSTQLKKFKNNAELLTDWVKWRLSIYELRRKKKIELLTEDLDYNLEKIRFIEYYIPNSKEFSKKKKLEIESMLLKEKFKKEYLEDFLSIKIYNLTYDSITKLKEETKAIKEELNYYKKTTKEDLYKKELSELK